MPWKAWKREAFISINRDKYWGGTRSERKTIHAAEVSRMKEVEERAQEGMGLKRQEEG